ncbi:MAG: LptF/LptG family permease [Paludibacteraceae bacterium]|nr:LptF/LptG family permease [Paludibacteraceae bacterium]MBN2787987.1 LptF/LptG family permease [Paludibacteraceae bacterium]
MPVIKQIDKYVFLRFLEVLFATFFICTFIFLMQFLWKHIGELVGKGLETKVLLEFFYYAVLSIVPMALPLAILLASLMSFGNLGEKMELTAMKAAGISLFRIMLSLLIFISFISIGAFFFSNDVLPVTQKKLWSLIFSLRQTSPELDIPQGEFYSGITGYNIYVREKDPSRKLLKNIMIYDFTKGFNNASVTVADSARIKLSADKTFLLLSLYSGESFENLNHQQNYHNNKNIPYRRENFTEKEVIIDFNTNFTRIDENVLQDQYMSKNLHQLQNTIDSLSVQADSMNREYANRFINNYFFDREIFKTKIFSETNSYKKQFNTDSLFFTLRKKDMEKAIKYSIQQANLYHSDMINCQAFLGSHSYLLIRHKIEWHKKFTLAFACLIFFFIGAPLGAIIRKGGLGMPVVVSVILFIIYYVIDFSGYKLAREGVWEPWEGIWLSSFCLLPIGIFFTYKAAMDSPLFTPEAYVKVFTNIKKWFLFIFKKNNLN